MTTPNLDIPGSPNLSLLLASLTPSQQRYLAFLPHSKGLADAADQAHISRRTPHTWRCQVPAYREAERIVRAEMATIGHNLALNLAKVAAPRVMVTQIDRAIPDPDKPLTDRQLVVAQKAAEVVLKAAGVLDSDTPPTTRLTFQQILAKVYMSPKDP